MSSLDAVRRPEHTGEMRCWPCTVVNLLVVGALALVVGRRRKGVGLAVAAVGLTLVALRGYVVPYTPQFAPKLVAASPLPDEWFHMESATATPPVDAVADEAEAGDDTPDLDPDAERDAETGLAGDEPDGEELLATLVEVGAVTLDGEDVRLDPEFETAWYDAMEPLADLDTEALTEEVLSVAHAKDGFVFDGDMDDHEWVVLTDGSGSFQGRTWLSRPVAIAETAAVHALDEYVTEAATRRAAAGPLRMFLQTCPDCGTELREESAASCCGGYNGPSEVPPMVLACPDCRQRLYTFDD
ncbi:hypothetical protein [Halorarius litoreus]|uniref:hypothetical protein n=1 Tax=Halorarius litoreus TaxID=2962676 RepID=UPI0020CF9790|nr:hypothetical protein [Halorarius litoreus]